jgi:hypothetical protein
MGQFSAEKPVAPGSALSGNQHRKPAQSLPNTLPHFATAAADTSLFGIGDITRLPMDETAGLACAGYLTSRRTIVPA